jgi:hypothetical protein
MNIQNSTCQNNAPLYNNRRKLLRLDDMIDTNKNFKYLAPQDAINVLISLKKPTITALLRKQSFI